MKGIIFTFGDLDPKDLVRMHNHFLGRVVKVKRGGIVHHYYYPGTLDSTPFLKISNGCYFVPIADNLTIRSPGKGPLNADIDIEEEQLKTGAQYFLEKYKGIKVNNLE